jgi:hypothetical protein
VLENDESINIKYYFEITDLTKFEHEIKILKKQIKFVTKEGKVRGGGGGEEEEEEEQEEEEEIMEEEYEF